MRWTEQEAKSVGFVQDKNGEWHLPKQKKPETFVDNSREVPLAEHRFRKSPERCAEEEKGRKEEGERLHRRADIKGRVYFRVVAYCARISDPDNLCPKWYIDEIVKAGLLPDDSSVYVAGILKEVVKVKKKSEERTLIEMYESEEAIKKEIIP